jgi:hypothetical protein
MRCWSILPARGCGRAPEGRRSDDLRARVGRGRSLPSGRCGVSYVPGITSAQGAASSTGVPLTHRGLATGVRYVTGHRAKDAALDLDWASLASEDTTLVVYMGAGNIAEIALQLMRHGMAPALPVLAVSAATTPRETRLLSTLGQIGTEVAKAQPEAPVLFVIGRVAGMYSEIAELDAALCEGAGMAPDVPMRSLAARCCWRGAACRWPTVPPPPRPRGLRSWSIWCCRTADRATG